MTRHLPAAATILDLVRGTGIDAPATLANDIVWCRATTPAGMLAQLRVRWVAVIAVGKNAPQATGYSEFAVNFGSDSTLWRHGNNEPGAGSPVGEHIEIIG